MGLSEFIYVVILKHGKIIIAILGLIVAILVYLNMQRFGIGVHSVMVNSVDYCDSNSDCMEWCGSCVSVKDGRYCQPNDTINCVCKEHACKVA